MSELPPSHESERCSDAILLEDLTNTPYTPHGSDMSEELMADIETIARELRADHVTADSLNAVKRLIDHLNQRPRGLAVEYRAELYKKFLTRHSGLRSISTD